MRQLLVLAFTLILGCSFALAGPVTIVNPGFETGDFTGWSQSGNTGFTGVSSSAGAHSGNYNAFFGPIGSLGYITQNLVTTPGAAYDLSFWLVGSGTPNAIEVFWDGNLVFDASNVSYGLWTQITIQRAVTSSASTPLALGFQNDPSFLFLDDVSVSNAIPEPSTFLMLGVGALLIGLRRLRRV